MKQETLDKQSLKEITKLVSDIVQGERKRQLINERTWRIKNTKLLLKNYSILKNYTQDVRFDIDELLKDTFSKEELRVRSIDEYRVRTAKMMEYTDIRLADYKRYASQSDEVIRRRYYTLIHTFITPTKMKRTEIASHWYCTDKTIQRAEQDAIKEFSIFLFGITSLEELVE